KPVQRNAQSGGPGRPDGTGTIGTHWPIGFPLWSVIQACRVASPTETRPYAVAELSWLHTMPLIGTARAAAPLLMLPSGPPNVCSFSRVPGKSGSRTSFINILLGKGVGFSREAVRRQPDGTRPFPRTRRGPTLPPEHRRTEGRKARAPASCSCSV